MIPKFRSWNKDKNIMTHFSNEFMIDDISTEGLIFFPIECGHGMHGNKENFVLMQSTGLKDKNRPKKEIFEGDVVSYRCKTGRRVRSTALIQKIMSRRGAYVFVCHDPKFDMKNTGPELDKVWINLTGVKVIGNIHENPELLKETLTRSSD